MKKNILTFAMTGLIVAGSLTAFAQDNSKTEKERKDLSEAQKDLRQAKTDSAADFQKFKKEAEINISENQKKIAELKARKVSDSKEMNEKYEKNVAALEEKNNSLKKKIEGADNTQTSMWTSFKREFSHDMEELGHAFKDIGVNNAK